MLALVLSLSAHAVPGELLHTGRLLDSAGLPLTGSHTLDVKLYTSASGGVEFWAEQQSVAFDEGYFSIPLGTGTAIDEADLQGTVFIGVTVDGGTELARQQLRSVPYALSAGSVRGGVVDASEIRVDGTVVIDDSGTFVGSGGDGDTLAALTCTSGQVAVFDGSVWACGTAGGGGPVIWNDITGIPSDILDGDDDNDVLGALSCAVDQIARFNGSGWGCADGVDETQVETWISNGPLVLDAGTTIGGAAAVTDWSNLPGKPTLLDDDAVDWTEIANLPTGLADGIDYVDIVGTPAILDDGDVAWNEVSGKPAILDDGQVAWSELTGTPSVLDDAMVSWGELDSVPADLLDGDDDGLGALSCSSGEIPEYDGSNWGCVAHDTSSVSGTFTVDGPDQDLQVVLLLQGEAMVDTSEQANPVSANGTATISSSEAQFGSSSIRFGSGSVGYLEIPWNSAFEVSSSTDFTIDLWINYDASQPAAACQRIFQWGANLSNGFGWMFCNAGSTLYFGTGGSGPISTPINPLLGTGWHHLAVTRSSGTIRMFVDGVNVSTAAWSGSNTANTPLYFSTYPGSVGNGSAYWMAGYIDNFRFTNGRALWTSDFTPPAQDLDLADRVLTITNGLVTDIQ